MYHQARAVAQIAVLAFAAAMTSCGGSGTSEAQKANPPSEPQRIEVVDAVKLKSLVNDSWRDRPVVVNFWATWCTPCVHEMGLFADFVRNGKFKNAVFISLSVDDPDSAEERVKPFMKQRALPFPVYVLSERSPEAIARILGVDWTGGVPATFLFAKEGKLLKAWFEEVSESDLSEGAKSL